MGTDVVNLCENISINSSNSQVSIRRLKGV